MDSERAQPEQYQYNEQELIAWAIAKVQQPEHQTWLDQASYDDRVSRTAFWIYQEDCNRRGVTPVHSESFFLHPRGEEVDVRDPWMSSAQQAVERL